MNTRSPLHALRTGALAVVLAVVLATLALPAALAQQADAEPARGGTLVVAMFDTVAHLNPAITTGGSVHAVADSIFDGLVRLDADGTPRPALAEAWEVLEDGRIYRFHLRDDVTWHDGEPFTARDVRVTFEEILLRFHTRTRGGLGDLLEEIRTPDAHTVEFVFDAPYAALLQRLDVSEAPILPAHLYEGRDPLTHEANRAPVGTGPFVFERFRRDDRIDLVRNDAYFRDGLPYLDALTFRIIPDPVTRMLALERGEVDHVLGFPASEVARAGDDVVVRTVPHSAGGSFCQFKLAFNLDRAPFDDARVRRAFAHAVDRATLLERVAFGQGRVATGPISSDLDAWHADDLPTYPLDPARAETLLDAAGLPPDADGVRLEADFLHFPMFTRHAETIRQDLAQVGVDLRMVALDRASYVARVYGDRAFDVGFISSCNNADPSIGVAPMHVSSNVAPAPFSNAPGYRDAEVDRLFAEAATDPDPERRRALYDAVQHRLVEDLPYLWLIERRYHQASTPAVRGVETHRTSAFTRTWLDR
ncbi:MAG: ABC transporter substrate-binding protein [Trueperaceae bacterium]|nr:ABC transporter substrate-binding protein [Trueperaceae bacterium]